MAIQRFKIIDIADPQQTIAGIKRDVEFEGSTSGFWYSSIFICSIGLNVDSTAVVIGAMLISPLMGPIMGIGSVGVQDVATVRSSISNLAVASASPSTSALYFFVSIHEASNELFARTQPTFLDVMVALFGGLAGILAGSRKEKSNVVPGVAIATALMPPLCTAGYGLANGEWNFLFGGFYLFLINTMLIATATTLVIRYLRFPVVELVDTSTERKYKQRFTLLLIALVVPSTYIFYQTVSTSIEDALIQDFVEDRINYPGVEIVGQTIDREGEVPRLNVVLLGEFVPEPTVIQWREDFARLVPGGLSSGPNSRDDQSWPNYSALWTSMPKGGGVGREGPRDRCTSRGIVFSRTDPARPRGASLLFLGGGGVGLVSELSRVQAGPLDDVQIDSLALEPQIRLWLLRWGGSQGWTPPSSPRPKPDCRPSFRPVWGDGGEGRVTPSED